uniref:phosphotransferase n=1 Tax=Agathobacter sp. TaxID=2021311 RepID=UPI004055AA0E
MYNQTEIILEQYEIEINQLTKGRGAYICDTSDGKKILVPFRGSKERGLFLKVFLENLKAKGFLAEQILLNKEGEAVTEDEATGEHFILKDYWEGTEMKTGSWDEMKQAARLLASYHNYARQVVPIMGEFEKGIKRVPLYDMKTRHYKVLVQVKNHIRTKRKKNEFEQIYMKNYEKMLTEAQKSIEVLGRQENANETNAFCHGDFNQHNVIFTGREWRIIHFESFILSNAMGDLANFVRKMLEKNNYDPQLGVCLLECYDAQRHISDAEYETLYGLFLFPEKFWKVTSHYMHSHKAWISQRDIEKLKKVIEQEEQKAKFMEKLFAFMQ